MPNPNPIPIVFPSNNKSCPKCGSQVAYPGSGTGRMVILFYNSSDNTTTITCPWCQYSVKLPASS